jgi:hypothetical protein
MAPSLNAENHVDPRQGGCDRSRASNSGRNSNGGGGRSRQITGSEGRRSCRYNFGQYACGSAVHIAG